MIIIFKEQQHIIDLINNNEIMDKNIKSKL